jgi:rod shape determining protein RodA
LISLRFSGSDDTGDIQEGQDNNLMKFDRRLFINFDWTLLFLVLAVSLIGLINIYSSGVNQAYSGQDFLYIKQVQWIIVGLVFMIMAFSIDYRLISRYAYLIYAFSILLLVVVFFYGYATRGSQRWILIGGFTFQPSELVKLTLILVLARYFDDHRINKAYRLRELFIPVLIMLVPFLLILKQPDLGTALVLFIIFCSMTLFIGVQWKSLTWAALTGLLLIPMGWYFLKDYQKERIMTFFNPDNDPLGAGYHVIQSIIAIGSGGFVGKGFLKGTQTQLRFLPERHTDFVFSVFAEEWGFLGGIFLLVMFMALILWGLKIALHSRDFNGTLISVGITALIFWEVFINIGMVLGMLPVVGIPLPFLSYGGSSMVILMISIGLLMNVSMRRFILQP